MRSREYDHILTRDTLTELYVNCGWTLDDLQSHFNINRSTIHVYLRRHGIKSRQIGSWCRTHSYNERFFAHINTYDKAYILGLLVSDGYVSKRLVSIALQEKDGQLLQQIAQLMGDISVVVRRKSDGRGLGQTQQDQYILSISSKQLAEDLFAAGVPPSPKSGKERFIAFPDPRMTWCFVRGIFDGDGTVGKYQSSFTQKGREYGPYTVYQFAVACGLDLLRGLSDFLSSQDIIVPPKGIIAKDNTGWLRLQHKDTIRRIREYLYRDGTLWLERKKQVFDSI